MCMQEMHTRPVYEQSKKTFDLAIKQKRLYEEASHMRHEEYDQKSAEDQGHTCPCLDAALLKFTGCSETP